MFIPNALVGCATVKDAQKLIYSWGMLMNAEFTINQQDILKSAREYDFMRGFIPESYFEEIKGDKKQC